MSVLPKASDVFVLFRIRIEWLKFLRILIHHKEKPDTISFFLQDGIMNLNDNGKDYVFSRAHGDAEW